MKKRDWSKFTRRGIPQKFMDNLLEMFAVMKVLSDRKGMEKASQVFFHIWDNVGYDMMSPEFPSVEDLKACGDAFGAFKEWMKAFDAANERVGLFELEVVEDSSNAYATDVKYCVWNEIAKELGNSYLAYPPFCVMDKALFPRLGAKAGWQYQRTGALTTGASVCDLKFERSPSTK